METSGNSVFNRLSTEPMLSERAGSGDMVAVLAVDDTADLDDPDRDRQIRLRHDPVSPSAWSPDRKTSRNLPICTSSPLDSVETSIGSRLT